MMLLRRPGIVLLVLLVTVRFDAAAQRNRDTASWSDTTAADTVVVGAQETSGSTTVPDTSVLTGTGQETGPVVQDSMMLRIVPDSTTDRWKHDPHFAYANDPAYWRRHPAEKQAPKRKSGGSGQWVNYIILGILAAVLVFAIVQIVMTNDMGLFYRRRKTGTAGAVDEPDAGGEEDLDKRLQYFLDKGEHRQAVRYLYLRSLRELGDRELIRLHQESTNEEYLRQLRGTPQEPAFRFLTRAYEKVWYGEFALSEPAFRQLFQYFSDFDKNLPS